MADLPTGIVTFLFTHIEGSTRLWEQEQQLLLPLVVERLTPANCMTQALVRQAGA